MFPRRYVKATKHFLGKANLDPGRIEYGAEVSGKYFDLFSMIISGAISSLGAALVPAYLVGREIADGSLVALSGDSIMTENKYYLVTPENIHNEHVQQFCEWIACSVSQSIHME